MFPLFLCLVEPKEWETHCIPFPAHTGAGVVRFLLWLEMKSSDIKLVADFEFTVLLGVLSRLVFLASVEGFFVRALFIDQTVLPTSAGQRLHYM